MMLHSGRIMFAVALVLWATASQAAPLHIVTVGDYHTQRYGGDALRQSFKTVGVAVTVADIASETLNATDIAGSSTTPSLSSQILAQNPDVVVFMMGTTDAARDQFNLFSQEFPQLLRDIEAYAHGRTAMTQLLISANIPVINDVTTSDRLANTFNPWLREQAENNGWLYVDLEARLIDITRWQRLYADGSRLNAMGYDWMTVTIRNQIMELPFPDFQVTPEPQTGSLLVYGCLALLRGRRKRPVVSSDNDLMAAHSG